MTRARPCLRADRVAEVVSTEEAAGDEGAAVVVTFKATSR